MEGLRASAGCVLLASAIAALIHAQPPDAATILDRADRFRGNWPSVMVKTRIDNYDGETLAESADFDIAVKGDNTLVTFLSPKYKGQTLLSRGDDMWIYLPSVARGVRITPIQRLLGNASNGDLARLRYALDYTPAITGEETVNGTTSVVLDLQAKRKGATYQRIRYAVRKGDSLPIKADFFLTSGRQVKTAFFEELKRFAGQEVVSRIVIYDELRARTKTIMHFLDFVPRPIDDKTFNPSRNQGP